MKIKPGFLIALLGVPLLLNAEEVAYRLRVIAYDMGRPCQVFEVVSTENSNGIRESRLNLMRGWEVVFEGRTNPALLKELYEQIARLDFYQLEDSYFNQNVSDGYENIYELTVGDRETKSIFISNRYHEYFDGINRLVSEMFPSEDTISSGSGLDYVREITIQNAEQPASGNPDKPGA